MRLNRIIIYAGLTSAKNTGIGKYAKFLIKSLRKYKPHLVYINNKNLKLRLFEEFLVSFKSMFLKRNDLCIFSSERDLPFSIFSRSAIKIIVIHDLRFLKEKGIRNFILKKIFSLTKFQKIICVSKSISKDLGKLGYRSEILYNPVEIKNKQLIYNKKLYCIPKKDKLEFCTLGSFEKRKNIEYFLYAAEFFPKYKFNIFIGKFYFENANRNTINKIRKINNINLFVGLNDNKLFKKMKNSKIFLSFSNYEGFGRTYIEAQKIGIPVLALSNNITKEVLLDSAFLMKEFSITNFSKGVEEIVNNYDLYVRKSFINSDRFSYKKFDKKLNNIVSDFL